MYSGNITGTGARYCPSIEDKIVRFADKPRHQFFLEPEGADTNEVYVQGISTSLPPDVQKELLNSIDGLRGAEIMRDAYAIEYDCIDSRMLLPSLESKRVRGLYFAGQLNGTSGYEEAAAQGLIAGLNAALSLSNRAPLILKRSESYIGVLLDDLTVKGTNEPYRMMTGRAEYRLSLRQSNADMRLTEYGYKAGLIDGARYAAFLDKKAAIAAASAELDAVKPPRVLAPLFAAHNLPAPAQGLSLRSVLKRGDVTARAVAETLGAFGGGDAAQDVLEELELAARYEGYIDRQTRQIKEAARLEDAPIPPDFDYSAVSGLRNEARQKLSAARPETLGRASRISGVNPADIAVLILYLSE
jgi:tRNA uridine 5-carboxymethylaminomethyl modification enzyme